MRLMTFQPTKESHLKVVLIRSTYIDTNIEVTKYLI